MESSPRTGRFALHTWGIGLVQRQALHLGQGVVGGQVGGRSDDFCSPAAALKELVAIPSRRGAELHSVYGNHQYKPRRLGRA